jgi:hypothetical protein
LRSLKYLRVGFHRFFDGLLQGHRIGIDEKRKFRATVADKAANILLLLKQDGCPSTSKFTGRTRIPKNFNFGRQVTPIFSHSNCAQHFPAETVNSVQKLKLEFYRVF